MKGVIFMLKLVVECTEVFDERCANWSKDREYNIMFLRYQQQFYNDLLRARGCVFLSDILNSLGINTCNHEYLISHKIGWTLNEKLNDVYIDFGIEYDDSSDPCIKLNFNVNYII